MNWLDFILVIVVAAVTALAAERKLAGLLVSVGALILFRPLLALAQLSPLLALLAALAVGLALGLAGRYLVPRVTLPELASNVLGGAGGFVLGCTLVLALVTALPIERSVVGNAVVYPPREVPSPLRTALAQSELVGLGKQVLLYPLLAQAGQVEADGVDVLPQLHHFLVAGRPWEGR